MPNGIPWVLEFLPARHYRQNGFDKNAEESAKKPKDTLSPD